MPALKRSFRKCFAENLNCKTKDSLHLSSPTSQFLNGTHEFSELVLARMVLFMYQSRSVLLLRSSKAWEFGELWREKMHVRTLDLAIKAGQSQFFSAGQTEQPMSVFIVPSSFYPAPLINQHIHTNKPLMQNRDSACMLIPPLIRLFLSVCFPLQTGS